MSVIVSESRAEVKAKGKTAQSDKAQQKPTRGAKKAQ